MDSDNDSYNFPKCQTHAYTRFENGCSENSTQKLLTKYSTEENNKHVICRPRSVRIGKNCALGLGYGPRPAASGRTQDLWHSFSQYGPPGRQITYIYIFSQASERAGFVNPRISLANSAHVTGPVFYDMAYGPDFFSRLYLNFAPES